MSNELGFRIPGVALIDIECTCCGERLVELTGADAVIALFDHDCLDGELLRLQAHNTADLSEAYKMLASQWKRSS